LPDPVFAQEPMPQVLDRYLDLVIGQIIVGIGFAGRGGEAAQCLEQRQVLREQRILREKGCQILAIAELVLQHAPAPDAWVFETVG
jgi:hypothetical protein